MLALLTLTAGYLVARKVTDDLEAFQPGPPRLADLMAFLLPLVVMVLADLGLGGVAAPLAPICASPCWQLA